MKRAKKTKKDAWFIKVRWSYLPSSWQGWLTYIPMLLFLIGVFILIRLQHHSLVDTALLYTPYLICTGVIMTWIAEHTS